MAPPGPLGRRDVIAAFARETGLPRFMLDESVPLDLRETRERFARDEVARLLKGAKHAKLRSKLLEHLLPAA